MITRGDQKRLGKAALTSEGQQVWEALAILVALRLWGKTWLSRHTVLKVKSDSMSALIAMARLKGRSPGVIAIMREMALDIGAAAYLPTTAQHIPGISNDLADALSRQFETPAKTLPAELAAVKLVRPEPRDRSWWIAAMPTARKPRR